LASLEGSSSPSVAAHDERDRPELAAARIVSELLIRYLELGAARPPGALTPEEALKGVHQVSNSDELGRKAGRLTTFCDLVLYGDAPGAPSMEELLGQARALFQALGKVKAPRRSAG
jgi:hypothetical protein